MHLQKPFLIILALLISAFGVSIQNTNAAQAPAQRGDRVTLEYTGTLSDGTVFDASDKHDTPLEFKVGAGDVIPGFENAVKGMKVGDQKKFTLQAAEAYGESNPQLVQKVPRKELPQDQKPEVGMGLVVGGPGGQQMRAYITEVTKETVTIDMNHPLAGKALTFNIKVVKISN